MRRRAFGGQGEQTLRLRAGDKRRVIRMALHGSELVIVQSGASQAFIVPGEAHRLNDMQTEAQCLAHRRIIFPVFGGISGSNNTMFSIPPLNCGGRIADIWRTLTLRERGGVRENVENYAALFCFSASKVCSASAFCTQRITADFTDTFRPGEGHRHFHLFLDEVQQIRHALLTVGRQGVQVSAAQ